MYPLLLCLFERHVKDVGEQIMPWRKVSEPTEALLKMCADSANKTIQIISALRQNHLLRE